MKKSGNSASLPFRFLKSPILSLSLTNNAAVPLKIKITFEIVCLFMLCFTGVSGQNPGLRNSGQVDSLKREIAFAKYDSTKIRLRYNIAIKTNISRIGYWDSLISDARNLKVVVFEIRAYTRLARIFSANGNESGANRCLTKAIQLATETKRSSELLSPLLVRSRHYFLNNDVGKALENCYKALRVAEGLKDSFNTARCYSVLGDIYVQKGEEKKGLEWHLLSQRYFERLHSQRETVVGLLNIGSDYWALRDTAKTVAYYLSSLKYLEDLEEPVAITNILNCVSAAYGLKRKYDSAYHYSLKAIEFARFNNDKRVMASSMATQADILLKKNDAKAAIMVASDAIMLANQTNFIAQIPDLAIILKNAYIKTGNYPDALKAYALYVSSRDSVRNQQNRKIVLEKDYKYNLEKKENENKLLAQQYQIQSLLLSKNRNFLTALVGITLLVVTIAFLIFRQNKLKTAQQKLYLEQKLISSQMNPHFIFNSLNSIQQMIMKNENEKAELYLSKFSKLIRDLLESNAKETLSLKHETEILQGYLEMESRRFSKSFYFSFKIDDRIDPENSFIPHMMIQSLLENAIWHGLLPKKGERNLTITYEYDTEKTIRCIIDDNGVGRQTAFKKQNTFKKQSLALSFVRQRLDLMRETQKVNCSLEIIDKKDVAGESLGTKILIVMPLTHT